MSFVSDKFNESFNLNESTEYRNYIIIDTDNGCHIRDSKGNFVAEVPTDDEATEFIDNLHTSEEEQVFIVKYINSVDEYAEMPIKAMTMKEAENKAEKMPEVYKIIH